MDFHSMFFMILLLGIQVYSQEEGEDESEKDKEKCQEEFYDITGTIESPEYPNNYPDKTNCAYRIFTDRMINVRFETFSVEESDGCQFDFINVIFNASSGNPRPQRYCGDGLSKVEGGNLRGKGPLIIGFVSDDSANMGGFRFTFELELNGPDPCLSEPCQQGGNCSSHPGYYICTCPDGYVGINCEINKDECLSYPCENNGNCNDGINSFTCECINGFEGDLCEIGGDRCASEPCENGGLCVDRNLDFVCSCLRDFMGDTCETPIPTSPPKETPTTQAPTTAAQVPTTTTTEASEKPDYLQDGSLSGDDETPTSPSKDDDTEKVERKEPPDSDSNSSAVLIIVVVLLLALAILAALVWYWWTHRAKPKDKRVEKPTREVTLINMKTKSERGEGKNGQRQSHTTSINSITMKGKSGDDQLINQLKKMSEDIIMEEVIDDPHSTPTKQDQHASTANHSSTVNKQLGRTALNNPSSPVTDQPQLKRISIPITQSELNKMTSDKNTPNNPYGNDTFSKEPSQPYRISPDAAVNLFNQLKQNQGKDFDYRSAIERYGPFDFNKKPFPNATTSPLLSPNLQQKQGVPIFQTPLQNNQIFQLPNVPIQNDVTYGKPLMEANVSPGNPQDEEMTELSPEEAAEVVNHFFRFDPAQTKNVTSNEAMDIIQQVRKKREASERPLFNREKSVIVHPREVAALINDFNNPPQSQNEDNAKSGSGLPSVYDSFDGGKNQGGWVNRGFREYSPIQEESDEEELRPPANKQKRPSQDFGNPEDVPEEPNSKRLKKKAKRFPYARTLDPEEKVHDWLKNTPKQKANKYKNSSPPESIATETHTLTRPTAKISYKEIDPTTENNESPNKEMAEDNDVPRTIRQGRKSAAEQSGGIPVTENKAKSLVEKLVKAPARSNRNIVGPGLGVSRENAFVGEAF